MLRIIFITLFLQCSQWTLNSIAEAQIEIFCSILGVDPDKVTRVLGFSCFQELPVLNDLVPQSCQVSWNKLIVDFITCSFCLSLRKEFARCFVKLHALKLSKDSLIGNLQCNDFLRLDLVFSQLTNLLHIEGTTIEDPSIQAAVRLA